MEGYDVVIIGAGPAGLSCARTLGGSKHSVLVIEKNSEIGPKVCAGGITLKDLKEIPQEIMGRSFDRMILYYRHKQLTLRTKKQLLFTCDRAVLGKYQLSELSKFSNIEVRKNTQVKKIVNNNLLELQDGTKVRFKYLVGADGAFSKVRDYLKLKTGKSMIAIQYLVKDIFPEIEIHFSGDLFGKGYGWIFPHKDFTSIGCGATVDSLKDSGSGLKTKLEKWIESKNISLEGAKYQAFAINADYQGLKFGNIFLVGDAAGLASAVTGEGIYAAIISGKVVAERILDVKKSERELNRWLRKKQIQERIGDYVHSRMITKQTTGLYYFLRLPIIKQLLTKLLF